MGHDRVDETASLASAGSLGLNAKPYVDSVNAIITTPDSRIVPKCAVADHGISLMQRVTIGSRVEKVGNCFSDALSDVVRVVWWLVAPPSELANVLISRRPHLNR
jgi:hypothetical protein